MKIVKIKTCIFCPHCELFNGNSKHKICVKSQYRAILREDDLLLNEKGEAIESKTPDWCPLEDYKE